LDTPTPLSVNAGSGSEGEWPVELVGEATDDFERELVQNRWADEARDVSTNRVAKADLVGDEREEASGYCVGVIDLDA
jgi:hypothetical protein